MAKNDKPEIEFAPCEWLRVITTDADAARRFFGAPPGWPVRFAGFSTQEHRKGRVWEVKAEGLTVR